jgi:uncharacterized protein (TIGR03086 family)
MSVVGGIMAAMNPLENYDRAAAAVTEIIAKVRTDQLPLPTACTQWDVRAVINHLAHGNARTVGWAGGAVPPGDGDFLGEDIQASFAESVRRTRAALSEPGLFAREVTTPIGTAPGILLVHMRVTEFLAHGWDIADATGQSTDIEPELVEQALSDWQARFGDAPRPPGAPFAAERPAAEGATMADRLAAFLGRQPVG